MVPFLALVPLLFTLSTEMLLLQQLPPRRWDALSWDRSCRRRRMQSQRGSCQTQARNGSLKYKMSRSGRESACDGTWVAASKGAREVGRHSAGVCVVVASTVSRVGHWGITEAEGVRRESRVCVCVSVHTGIRGAVCVQPFGGRLLYSPTLVCCGQARRYSKRLLPTTTSQTLVTSDGS